MKNSILSSRVEKVRFLSLALRTFCRVILSLELLVLIVGIVSLVSYGANWIKQPGIVLWGVRTGGGDVMGLLTLAYWALGMWTLERLFNVFVSGEVLDERVGRLLKLFGLWVATSMLLPVVLRLVQDLVSPGRTGAISVEPASQLGPRFLVGLFLIMLGWVLEEAGELKTEQALTV